MQVQVLPISPFNGRILGGATLVREVGQGRNPAALSDFGCVLYFFFLWEALFSCVFSESRESFQTL